ncbi:hypothetical protein GDO81_020305 [Engystomops pustulosus]|uniref:Uncharacterized protein n=1 Tax=Engystomops pustulosus TaxID=76066 RepID=A0AAV6YR35_ENGPU|nr:hypothetical protein GDO81_024446 [Engystomops pustulosus]KAG8539126.1 hypothetical protein GDO81_021390 [Engystomops pustulosus]KAG8539817.1 hypothetical protein GDO81_020305 [Engystomops pustulosus]
MCTRMRYSMGSSKGLLSLNQKNLRKFRCSSLTRKQWNICWMSAINATESLRNLRSTPRSRLLRSGPGSRTSFKETPSNLALESNTTLICPGFFGW